MDLILSEEQILLQQSAKTFVARNAGSQYWRNHRDDGGVLNRKIWREIAEAGWLGILMPEESGGLDLGMTELALVLEQGGRELMLEPIAASSIAAGAIARGDGAAKSDLLAAILSGEQIFLPALQENFDGSDLGQTQTATTADGDGIRLSGSKRFIPAAAGADGFLVSAKGSKGLLLCVVKTDDLGVSLTIDETIDASGLAQLDLEDVPVPMAQVIATENLASELVAWINDRLIVATSAELLGAATKAFEITVEYLKVREQFDRPIGSFQALQHIAVDEFINVEIAKSFVYRVCASMDFGQEDSAMAAAVKASTSGGALSVAKNAIQLHGGIGYTDEHDIGLYLKRVAALAAQYGNQAAQIDRYAQLTNAVAVG